MQALGAGHATGLCPVHAPAWQTSLSVHGLPSSQLEPSGMLAYEHAPVVVLQMPAWWQATGAAQTVVAPPVHAPLWQLSPAVHAFPSLHAAPSGFGA